MLATKMMRTRLGRTPNRWASPAQTPATIRLLRGRVREAMTRCPFGGRRWVSYLYCATRTFRRARFCWGVPGHLGGEHAATLTALPGIARGDLIADPRARLSLAHG